EGGIALRSAELYEPDTGTWTLLGSEMNEARREHMVTLLPATRQVLVAGGLDEHDTPLQSAELYTPGQDPARGTWKLVPDMHAARASSTAALLPTGEVLVAGGIDGGQTPLSSAEVFDPKEGGNWREVGFLKTGRKAHRAMLLPT